MTTLKKKMETMKAVIKHGNFIQVQQLLQENPQLINEVRAY
jgi:hypothetical protein